MCSVACCARRAEKRGYCSTHYAQIKHGGVIKHLRTEQNEREQVGDVIHITVYDKFHNPLPEKVLIDTDDVKIIDGKRIVVSSNKGLLRVFISDKIAGKNIKLSRVIMNAPEGMDVDHINRNPLDNRKENLRICDRTHNNMNRNKRGYSIHTQNKTYCVEIQKYGKRIRINGIKTEAEAKGIREKLEKEVFGEYAIDRSINATANA